MRTVAVLVATLVLGCGRAEKPKRYDLPPYLGMLFPEALPYWQAECPTRLVEVRTCGRRPWTRGCEAEATSVSGELRGSYTRATRMVQCPAPGWSIWTDDHDRIVAMCVDDVHPESRHLMEGADYVAFKLISKHLRDPWLGEYIRKDAYTAGLGPGWVRWQEETGLSIGPDGRKHQAHLYPTDTVYSDTYCWEVALSPAVSPTRR